MAAAALPAGAGMAAAGRPVLCIFSKHMGHYGWEEMGAKAKEIGFEGVDLTVRPKGHVLPERVTEDLPRAVEAIRKHGLSVPMVTTDLKDATDPAARPTFAAMQKLGIPLFKIGYWPYNRNAPNVLATIAECKRKFQAIVAMASEYGVTAGLHNHSNAYVGSAVWDNRELLAGTDPKRGGYYFDPGHSVVEGGLYGWRISLDIVLPQMKMVAIKDFYWEKAEGKWRSRWCPLGEGMVPWPEFFGAFAKAGYRGPLSLHLEYPGGDDLPSLRRDLGFMRKQVEAAYGGV